MNAHWMGYVTKRLVSRGRGTSLTILIYHRVHATADEMSPDEVDAEAFDWQMACLSRYFQVLPLDTAVELLHRAELPPGAMCVTFDDGYRDNYEVALPILRRHGVNATFFIATGYIDGGIMFNDAVIESLRRTALPRLDLHCLDLGVHELGGTEQRRAVAAGIIRKLKYLHWRERAARAMRIAEAARIEPPSTLMLTSEQVRALHQCGMRIGAHTVNHPILAQTPVDEAAAEISGSKQALEAITCEPVALFAYPNGSPGTDYGAEHVRLVKDLNFAAAVSTAPGVAGDATDVHQLPRFTPWDRAPARFIARLVQNSCSRKVLQV